MPLSIRLSAKPDYTGQHAYPFCWLRPWQMGEEFLSKCKIGILQYVVVRDATTALTLVLEPLGMYGEGLWDPSKGYMWITVRCE